MDATAVAERAARVEAVCADGRADPAAVESALVAVRELAGWVEARRAVLVGKLNASPVSFPEATIAAVDRTSVGAASKVKARSDTLAATPKLADALGDGKLTSAHVDAVTRGAAQLDAGLRDELLARVDGLVDVAAAATVEQFAKRVAAEVRKLQTDDGMDTLTRQLASARVSTWVDLDGMWNLRARLDPVTAVRIDATLRSTIETMFAEQTPAECPTDPTEKQKFLAAKAFAAVFDGRVGTARSGRPEYVVVIDADADHVPGPVADWSIPVEIPVRVLAELAGDGDIHAVVVRNGVVLHAPGELNLGRTNRLANRAQRRALRGLYRGCGIPGCSVGFDRCELHHIIWWRNGGRTDLDNLIPLCSRCHDRIHADGWIIELGPNRELTLRLPDGTIRTTGPPHRRTDAA